MLWRLLMLWRFLNALAIFRCTGGVPLRTTAAPGGGECHAASNPLCIIIPHFSPKPMIPAFSPGSDAIPFCRWLTRGTHRRRQ